MKTEQLEIQKPAPPRGAPNRRTLQPLLNHVAGGGFDLPADGWFQIVAIGEFWHPEHEQIQVIDTRAVAAILNSFRHSAADPNWPGILLDYDHFSYDTKQPSEAAGWITELQGRSDGLWARIRFADTGEAAVRNGRYRFASPTWLPEDIESAGTNRIRPLRIDRVALTNSPNLRGMKPLSNRQAEPAPTGADVPAVNPNQKDKMKQVALDLSAVKDQQRQQLAAVRNYQNRVGCGFERAWNAIRIERPQLFFNLNAVGIVQSGKPATPVLNGTDGKTPETSANDKSRQQMSAVRECRNRLGSAFEEAWNLARAEHPELFQP